MTLVSGASYSEQEHLIDSDGNQDDTYLSLTLEETEDDYNIEDLSKEQINELLSEEDRFLLEYDEPIESTSQLHWSANKASDAKSHRNTSNLITIDCDDEDDEDESETDDHRHSKFKSERIFKNKEQKTDEKDIPQTLETVTVDAGEFPRDNNAQKSRMNYPHYSNQRGKGRNFVPSSRPFIGNNSLSSMGLLPTPLQSFNRIHVNPNFKPLATYGPRGSNSMNNFRQMRPRGALNQPRMSAPPRPSGLRPVSCFADISPSGTFPANPIVVRDPLDTLVASQILPEYDLVEPSSSHQFLSNNNNNRPPLFNEPFSDNWSNQHGVQNQPWMRRGNRPAMGNFQRIPGLFNSDINLRSPLLGSIQHCRPVNNSLFGSPPRHPLQSRFSSLPLFNQPSFPLINPMELPRNRSQRIDITPHPVPTLTRHQIPLHLIHTYNPSGGLSQGQNRSAGMINSRSSVHQDNKSSSNHISITPNASSSNYGQSCGDTRQIRQQIQNDHRSHFSPVKNQEPASSLRSINKVTSSPSQRTPRPSTSNVNLKNIRQIKTISSTASSSTTDARKAALLKTKAARRFLQKENMNRGLTSAKQIEVVDLDAASTTNDGPEDQNKQQQPMVVDLDIDEDYKKKLEEQKRLREEIIRKKEERRKQMVAEKMKQGTSSTAPTSNPIPTTSTSLILSSDTVAVQQRRINPLTSTLIERASPPRDIQIISEKKLGQLSSLERKASLSSDESVVEVDENPSSDVKKVEIKGLALTTSKATITKLCTSVGPIEDCVVDVTNAEKKAIVTFKTSQDARTFQSRYQRHLVDLCVIQVSPLW